MAFSAGTRGISSEINVTPLIDVLLVLLIIFMVIAPVQSHGLDAAVPQPSHNAAPRPAAVEPIVVQVAYRQAGDPAYTINRQAVQIGELESRLASALAVRQDRTAFLAADAALDLEQVTEVMDRMQRAGTSEIGILTRKDCNQVGC